MIELHIHNGTIELFGLAHHPKRNYMDLDSPLENLITQQKPTKNIQFETSLVSCAILGVVFIHLVAPLTVGPKAFHGLQDHVNPFQGRLVGEFHPGGQALRNANPRHCTE